MLLDDDTCHRALDARDARFDGLFFVAIKTTGIYCRPVCPARIARRSSRRFFRFAAQAEQAGFRACLRCRPELAPGAAPIEATGRLVEAGLQRIEAGFVDAHSLEALAKKLGVTSRHLRRSFVAELGVTPVALVQARRLRFAKQLLQDTPLPLAELAYASGFRSVRRFNALFQARLGRAPSAFRRGRETDDSALRLRLDYRPPFAWEALVHYLRARAIAGVEAVDGEVYSRTVAIGKARGQVRVRHTGAHLVAEVSPGLAPVLLQVMARLRALFDLDAQPTLIAEHLSRDAVLAAQVHAHPGLRVPGAFDRFEVAVRAMVGQQVSVRAASTIAGRIAARFGEPTGDEGLAFYFPTAARLAKAGLPELCALGLPRARALALQSLARAAARGVLDVAGADAIADLQALPGIGPWTANYIAMRALGVPDAFIAGDLLIRRVLGGGSLRLIEARAAEWRPWRAYAVMHLWMKGADQ